MRQNLKTTLAAGLTALLLAGGAQAQTAAACGGDLGAFLEGVKAEALTHGVSADVADRALAGATIDQKVLSRDRAQGVFRQTFLEFSKRTVSQSRLDIGRKKLSNLSSVFGRAEQEFGAPGPVIAAFWAMETDFGAVQGDFNTRNALVTLSHDCRRPELFRPQLIAAVEMVGHGDLDPNGTTGAWAGEIGQVQMLPKDIIEFGVDGDGDNHINVKQSAPDAILTAAKFIQHLGFVKGQPWIQEVSVPDVLPFEKTGLQPGMKAADWFIGLVRSRRKAARRRYLLRQSRSLARAAAGPQGPRLHHLSELQHLPRLEPVLHLHDVGGLFCHALGRCPAL